MNVEPYDGPGQQQRRLRIYSLVLEYTLHYFDADGAWLKSGWMPSLRERLWFCFAYLGSGDAAAIQAANKIIINSEYAFCHFSPMACLQLLIKYRDRLGPEAIGTLEGYLKNVLLEFKNDDFDFVGVNDNFPCMGMYTALMGGTLFGDVELYGIGIKRLHQLKDLLSRRGVTSEYSSPTYTPIQVYALSEIVGHTTDAAVKAAALQCEERLWVDILGHYHPTTFQTAGPYSRAYAVDSASHTHQARFCLYAILGDKLAVNPLNTLFVSPAGQDGEVIHTDAAFMQVSAAWLAATDYHCPADLVDWALRRTYPYEFAATTEYSSSTDALPTEASRNPYAENDTYEYPAGSGSISTFMTEDYALGVATNEFHNGIQTDSFHLLYRRRDPAQSQKDMAAVFCRYIVNEHKPGGNNHYAQPEKDYGPELLCDEGRKIGLQYKNTAMMLYKPKIGGSNNVHSLKLSLIFPCQYGPVEEIWLGNRRLSGLDGQSAEPCQVFIKDGPVYMAFSPLLLTDYGRPAAVKVEKVNGYVMVSFYNYQGPSRDFYQRGFLLTGNGFVAEVSSQKQSGSFDSFRKMMETVQIEDTLYSGIHGRQTYLRRTKYSRPGLSLDCEYGPVSEGIKHAAVNGKAPEYPRLKATGLDASGLFPDA